ncbi:MAG: methionine adenosyltransferase [Bacilli bacterium]|nr:methionine adenosyltransferase [Bacilli bacterium]
MKKLFTSEMVCEGHPDKLCDQISDSILDEYLKHDENARVAVETAVSSKRVFIFGEVTSTYSCDVERIARDVIIRVGYDRDELGFNGNTIPILIDIHEQSPDISRGVNREEIGAGDQGIMFGYACSETEEYLPLCYVLSSKLAKRSKEVREEKILPYLRPDGKMQVTVEYKDNKPFRVDTIVISLQHEDTITHEKLEEDIKKEIIEKTIDKSLLKDTKYLINPTGRFVIGGPYGDSGLTGRKIVVDTYGGYARHGGGAFSGKDYTKVDRSAAYYARYVCKNLVASKICSECMIEVGYAIGVSKPVSISINTFGTSSYSEEYILQLIDSLFDFRPDAIIEQFDMKHMCYHELSSFGHFGRKTSPFEQLDKVQEIKKYIKEHS